MTINIDHSKEYHKAISYLSDLITNDKLHIGDRLPTERKLADILSISRNSTREALRTLEIMGVIECRRGSGNYLIGNMSKSISAMINMMLLLNHISMDDICSFRRNIDLTICSMILDNSGKSQWLNEAIVLLQSNDSPDIDSVIDNDREFHFLLVRATENPLMISLMDSMFDIYRNWIDNTLRNTNKNQRIQLNFLHMNIVRALEKGDHAECIAAINAHYNFIDFLK